MMRWLQAGRGPRRVALAAALLGGLVVSWATAAAQSLDVTELPAGGALFQRPLDATPDPDGQTVYFVATTEGGEAGVFRVPAAGGDVEVLHAGAPLVSARAIVISGDGSTLYVADPMAAGGLVFALPAAGGPPVPLVASVRTGARALDLVSVDGVDHLYIGGADLLSGQPAVYRVTLPDGMAETLSQGAPLTVVDGLAATHAGDVYIAAPDSEADAGGRVLRLRGGVLETVVERVQLGRPAGLALTLDETILLISSLAANGTSQVVIVNLETGAVSTANDGIGDNRASGGLHRAQNADRFAWAELGRNRGGSGSSGTVYAIGLGIGAP